MSKLSEAITGTPVSAESLVEAVRKAREIVDEALPVPAGDVRELRSIAFAQVLHELLAYDTE